MNAILSLTGLSLVELCLIGAAAVLLILWIILLVVVISQKRRVNELNDRITTFCQGADGASLENDILDMFDENQEIRDRLDQCDGRIQNLYWRMRSTIQKVGVIKYDAFANMGGMLSYAMILNCVHSVDSCYTYTKIVTDGRADVELGAEEAKALKMALDNFHPNGRAESGISQNKADDRTPAETEYSGKH